MRYDFLNVCNDVTKTATKIPQSEYLINGIYPIYDQGKDIIGGYRDDINGLANNFPFIVFGDHTRVIKYVNNPCFIGADGVKLLKVVNDKFLPKYVYYSMIANPVDSQGYSRHYKLLKETTIKYVEKEIQSRIIIELDNINNSIAFKEKKLSLLDELIKSRFIEMFGNRLNSLDRKISAIATPIIGLTYKPTNVTREGTIVLRSGNIQNNELQLEEDVVRVSNIKIPEQKWIKDKDILMCSRNGSARLVGKSCLIRNPDEQMSFGAFMTVIRTKYPYFLQGFFTSDYFKRQLTGVGTASVNQITSGMLNNYDVIEPTDDEEKEFESYVKQIDKSKFVYYSRYFL